MTNPNEPMTFTPEEIRYFASKYGLGISKILEKKDGRIKIINNPQVSK